MPTLRFGNGLFGCRIELVAPYLDLLEPDQAPHSQRPDIIARRVPLPHSPVVARAAAWAAAAEQVLKESVGVIDLQQIGGDICSKPPARIALARYQQPAGRGLADAWAIEFSAGWRVRHAVQRERNENKYQSSSRRVVHSRIGRSIHDFGRSSQCRPSSRSSQSSGAVSIDFIGISGAGSRVRTRDPLITNQVLYQLSYTGLARHVPSCHGRCKPLGRAAR